MDLARADVGLAREAIAKHRDMIVGVKARLSRDVAGPNDYEVLRRTQDVASSFGLPVMIHMGQTISPLAKLFPLLKRGDIVTHMFAPGTRRHIRRALDLGVSTDEIVAVLQLTATLGLHTMSLAAPLLQEELRKRQATPDQPA